MKILRVSILPALACLAAFFAFLPRTGADATVRIIRSTDGFIFEPASIAVDPGQRIAFVNESKVTHTATCVGCPKGSTFDTGDVQPGQTIFATFPREGRFGYRDRYHPEATGVVVAGNPPPEPAPSRSPSP